MKKKISFLIIGISIFFIVLGYELICKQQNIDNISTLQNLSDVDYVIKSEEVFSNAFEMELLSLLTNNLENTVTDNFINYKIRYKSGEYEVTGMISAPIDYLEKDYHILIHNRGGNNEYGKENLGIMQTFASYGFIVLASNYRGIEGGTGKDEFGGGEIEDVTKLVDLAERMSFGNGKIYMHGWSRGGMMTYCAIRGVDTRIDAAVVFAADADIERSYNHRELQFKKALVRAIGGNPKQMPDEYKKRSALFWPNEINTPLLIIHGEKDDRVNVEQSKELYEKMQNLGKHVELKILYDSGHDITPEIINIITQWLLLQ